MLDHLFPTEKNVARYLPAVSHTYALAAVDVEWQCSGLPGPMLDHLQRGGVFHYPACLASYGQVAKDGRLDVRPTMISERHRAMSFVIADSGGFQIQQGSLGEWKGDHTVLQSLRWMEQHGDFVMALDFPTGGIDKGHMRPHTKRLIAAGEPIAAMCSANGLSPDFNACLRQTEMNTALMLSKRAKGPGFLVVLQGRDEAESSTWYRAMKPFIDQAEGVAFAGEQRTSYRLILHRLLDMRDDGTLARIKHIHVLGTGTMESGVLLTSIQRLIRTHINRHIQITYDTATPHQEANERYRVQTSYIIDKLSCSNRFDCPTESFFEEIEDSVNVWCARKGAARRQEQRADGRYGLFLAHSGIGRLLKVKDLLRLKAVENSDLNAFEFKPNGETALLMSAHNVQAYVDAQREAIGRFHHTHIGRAHERDNFHTKILVINALIEDALDPRRLHGLCSKLAEEMSSERALTADGIPVTLPPSISGYHAAIGHSFIEQHRKHLDTLI